MLKKELKKIKSEVDPVIFKELSRSLSGDFKELTEHQIKTGGKRVRPFLLITLFNCLEGEGDPKKAAAAIEIFHNYSLLLDDIIDKGKLRRGEPTSWEKYGLEATLCSSSFYFSTITKLLAGYPKRVIELFSKETKAVMDGELIDVLQDRSPIKGKLKDLEKRYKNPDYDDYLEMIRKKTGGLFRLSSGLAAILAGEDSKTISKAIDFGDHLGVAYQIRDDILDIFGDQDSFGKKIGKDIEERKGGNIVIILAIQENPELLEIFNLDEIGSREVRKAIGIVNKTNAKNKAQKMANESIQEALSILDFFPKNRDNELLKELVNYLKIRKK